MIKTFMHMPHGDVESASPSKLKQIINYNKGEREAVVILLDALPDPSYQLNTGDSLFLCQHSNSRLRSRPYP